MELHIFNIIKKRRPRAVTLLKLLSLLTISAAKLRYSRCVRKQSLLNSRYTRHSLTHIMKNRHFALFCQHPLLTLKFYKMRSGKIFVLERFQGFQTPFRVLLRGRHMQKSSRFCSVAPPGGPYGFSRAKKTATFCLLILS